MLLSNGVIKNRVINESGLYIFYFIFLFLFISQPTHLTMEAKVASLEKALKDTINQLNDVTKALNKMSEEKTALENRIQSEMQQQPQQQQLQPPVVSFNETFHPRITPQKFNGTNRNYPLNNFLSHLTITFTSQPNAFSTDKSKILLTLSCLEGAALQYFVSRLRKMYISKRQEQE